MSTFIKNLTTAITTKIVQNNIQSPNAEVYQGQE